MSKAAKEVVDAEELEEEAKLMLLEMLTHGTCGCRLCAEWEIKYMWVQRAPEPAYMVMMAERSLSEG